MESGTQMTLEEYMPEIFQEQIAGVSDSHVRTSPLQENSLDFKGTVQACFSELCTLSDNSEKKIDPLTFSLRTLKICLVLMEDGISPDCSLKWSRGGYDAEWQVLNSKDFGVPQNRERCFIIGHLRGRSTAKVFPVERADGENSVSLNLFGCLNGRNSQRDRVYSGDGLAPTISTKPGGNTEPKVSILFDTSYIGQDGNEYNVCIKVAEATKQGYSECRVGIDSVNLSVPGSKTRRGRVGRDVANTLDTSCNQGIFVQVSEELTVYAVWYEKYQCYIAIRRLTPKECFRLQGWTDDYFEKAEFVNSDSQLYKQAGNGVTVNVIRAIAERIKNE
nr:MAG TPA: Cytosine specific methyltransferase [Caudoviricetes sp.]